MNTAAGLRAALALAGSVVLLGCGAPPPPPQVPQPETTSAPDEPPEAEEPATIDIMSREPTEIRVDGKPIGKTPITGHKVKPGSHDVTFVFSESDSPTLNVTLAAGDAQTIKLDPPPPIQESGGNKEAPPKKK